jgi:hypothetical protein
MQLLEKYGRIVRKRDDCLHQIRRCIHSGKGLCLYIVKSTRIKRIPAKFLSFENDTKERANFDGQMVIFCKVKQPEHLMGFSGQCVLQIDQLQHLHLSCLTLLYDFMRHCKIDTLLYPMYFHHDSEMSVSVHQ